MMKNTFSFLILGLALTACGGSGGGSGSSSTATPTNPGIQSNGYCTQATYNAWQTASTANDPGTLSTQCTQLRSLIGANTCQYQQTTTPSNQVITLSVASLGVKCGTYNGTLSNYVSPGTYGGTAIDTSNACGPMIVSHIRTLGNMTEQLIDASTDNDNTTLNDLSRKVMNICNHLKAEFNGGSCYIMNLNTSARELMSMNATTVQSYCNFAYQVTSNSDDE